MKLTSFESLREQMVLLQIMNRSIKDERILEVMGEVPRHIFVPPDMQEMAYEDGPLPIGCGQTISQPYIVALMTSLLELKGDENVLEIGTGSGYQAAILAHLAKTVHTVEIHPELAERASSKLAELGLMNVQVHVGDGSLGWQAAAPYQAILITAAAPAAAEPIMRQLDRGGRLVLPIGSRYRQELVRYKRDGDKLTQEDIIPVAFVPLRGQHGWRDDEWFET
ncbi:MAG: protein-L-isoaspartate(D-aspartate) O-methyltransferase [Anaerolineaceae bacterium]|nr:protein-L-isoaspartate(D-aspartate) O-methyltransferase [Anaerolineaceae bacterium]